MVPKKSITHSMISSFVLWLNKKYNSKLISCGPELSTFFSIVRCVEKIIYRYEITRKNQKRSHMVSKRYGFKNDHTLVSKRSHLPAYGTVFFFVKTMRSRRLIFIFFSRADIPLPRLTETTNKKLDFSF